MTTSEWIGFVIALITCVLAIIGGIWVLLQLKFKNLEQGQTHIKELLNAKIDPIEKNLNNHVTGTDKKIDKLDNKVDKLDDKVDKKVEKLEVGQNDLKTGQNNLDKKIDQLLKKK